MIIDNISNANIYTKNNPDLKRAFDYINECISKPFVEGRFEIDGDNMYAIVAESALKEKGRLEAHDKYIDIQYIYEGSEAMRVCNRKLLVAKEDCLAEKDAIFFEPSPFADIHNFFEGDFAIFYPNDAHEPVLLCEHKDNTTSKKIDVKIKV